MSERQDSKGISGDGFEGLCRRIRTGGGLGAKSGLQPWEKRGERQPAEYSGGTNSIHPVTDWVQGSGG